MVAATHLATLATLFALALPAGGSEPSALAPGWKLDRFAWEGEIAAGKRVVIRNDYGDVRTRDAEGSNLELSAVLQEREADPDPPRVEVAEKEDRLEIRVVRPAPAGQALEPATPGRPSHRADLVVFLPSGLPLSVSTTTGMIEAKGLDSPAELRSQSGEIRIATRSSADVRTELGAILAWLRASDWKGPVRLETATGDIRVQLPREADVAARIATPGEITTDYSIEIRHDPESGLKQATATIGAGGHELAIRSAKGNIKLLRFPN